MGKDQGQIMEIQVKAVNSIMIHCYLIEPKPSLNFLCKSDHALTCRLENPGIDLLIRGGPAPPSEQQLLDKLALCVCPPPSAQLCFGT